LDLLVELDHRIGLYTYPVHYSIAASTISRIWRPANFDRTGSPTNDHRAVPGDFVPVILPAQVFHGLVEKRKNGLPLNCPLIANNKRIV
jgi:hypothetical protein